MSPIVLGEILGVFAKTLTTDGKYPVKDCKNLQLSIQMQLSEKRKNVSRFFWGFFIFWKLHQVLKILKRKKIVMANVFPILQTVKKLVRTLSKEQRFKTGFSTQHVKASQTPAKSQWECFYHVFSSISGKLIWKMSPLVLRKILGVFVNISTADDKYRVQYCENLPVPIQMQLSQNRKNVSQFFVPFLKSTSNFQHFRRKDDRHSWCICEITDCEKPI